MARQEKQSTFDAAVFFLDSVLQQVCAVHLRSGRPGDQLSPTAAAVVAAGEALLQLVSSYHTTVVRGTRRVRLCEVMRSRALDSVRMALARFLLEAQLWWIFCFKRGAMR